MPAHAPEPPRLGPSSLPRTLRSVGTIVLALVCARAVTAGPLELSLDETAALQEPACSSRPHPAVTAPAGEIGARTECGGPVSLRAPLLLPSGEAWESVTDLRIPGRGLDFVWTRTYRSRIGPQAGLGAGWDHGYDLSVAAIDADPGEVDGLTIDDASTLAWLPPVDPGGAPEDLRYCVQRSTSPSDFADLAVSQLIATDLVDPFVVDDEAPPPHVVFHYLVTAKNGVHEGPLGSRSGGTPRTGLACGLSGPDWVLNDGRGRRERYVLQVDGTWTARGRFDVLTQAPDTSLTLTFPDRGTWRFNPFDGGPVEGRVAAVADRYGNTLSFDYDPQGRLATIVDTLDREISIGYDADGFLSTVTDFAGRQVSYAYYADGEPGGAFGDLKSATSPAVTGTPTGNDFPSGKTATYTYSTGTSDPRLDHNLLTIVDPKGQTYLEFVYSPATDPLALDFDRVARVIRGGGGAIDVSYEPLTPEPANGEAVLRATVNDAVGNVSEHDFDATNRAVAVRRFTGRADPLMPTTAIANRPAQPLRPDDPAWFETRWSYDTDDRPVSELHPNGNSESWAWDSANPERRSRGNLLEHCRLPGALGAAQPVLCESFAYDDGPTGSNRATSHVDARGHETVFTIDAAGDRVQVVHRIPSVVEDFEHNAFGQLTAHVLPDDGSGHRRRDEFVYYDAGPQRGYLQQVIVDAGGLALTTTHEVDARGNVTRTIDPLGNDTQWVYNALDQPVRELSAAVSSAGDVRSSFDTWYDADDNLVRTDTENVDETGATRANAELTRLFEYDALDRLVRRCEESGSYTGAIPGTPQLPSCSGLPPAEFATTEYEYDADGNRTLVRLGEAVEGRQPANTVRTLYDERDLVYRVVRAENSDDQSTEQRDYDGNGNTTRIRRGLETGAPRDTLRSWDGYDRLLTDTDPMGNVIENDWDAGGNLLVRRLVGERNDGDGDQLNVRLAETAWNYDDLDRPTVETVALFDPDTQLPIGDGAASTTTGYAGTSQPLSRSDDDGNVTLAGYDGAGRLASIADAAGNLVALAYDDASNLVSVTETELSELGNPASTFTTTHDYDELKRKSATADHIGNFTILAHDSRGNVTRSEDARRGAPQDPGNVTLYAYDGLDRLVAVSRTLTDDGEGGGLPVGQVDTSQQWDDSSRLVSRQDGNGHATSYEYDPLGRLTALVRADGTARSMTYDAHGDRVRIDDADGTSILQGFDADGRLTDRTVDRASIGAGDPVDVLGTTFETFAWDGAGHVIGAEDDDSLVERVYDSAARLVSETQNGATWSSSYDDLGRRTGLVYPGGRTLSFGRDALGRLSSIAEGPTTLAQYAYVGPWRVERVDYGNGTREDIVYDGQGNAPDDFGVRRPVSIAHGVVGGAAIDLRAYAWDRSQNRVRREDIRPGGGGRLRTHAYDSLSRLVGTQRFDLGELSDSVSYALDPVGNRLAVSGGSDPGPYSLDATAPEPADAQMNQYSATPFDVRQYDPDGSLLQRDGDGGSEGLVYDYRGQVVERSDQLSGTVTSYAYDVFGRRIARQSGADPPLRRFYDGDRALEEQDANGATLASFVAGARPREIVAMRRGGFDRYLHADDLQSTLAVTDATGAVLERYDYDDFGQPAILDPLGGTLPQSLVGNPWLFRGARFDGETGRYRVGGRDLDPRAGRFTTRDRSGIWSRPERIGNPFAPWGTNPWTPQVPCPCRPDPTRAFLFFTAE